MSSGPQKKKAKKEKGKGEVAVSSVPSSSSSATDQSTSRSKNRKSAGRKFQENRNVHIYIGCFQTNQLNHPNLMLSKKK